MVVAAYFKPIKEVRLKSPFIKGVYAVDLIARYTRLACWIWYAKRARHLSPSSPIFASYLVEYMCDELSDSGDFSSLDALGTNPKLLRSAVYLGANSLKVG